MERKIRVKVYGQGPNHPSDTVLDEVRTVSLEAALQTAEALVMMHAWERENVSAITITTDGEEYDPSEDR